MSKRFPNKDLLLSRLLESKNGNQIGNDKMIVFIIIIAAFQTHYNINMKAIGPEVNLSYQSSLLKHPTRRQNFANTLKLHCAHYLTLRLKEVGVLTWRYV